MDVQLRKELRYPLPRESGPAPFTHRSVSTIKGCTEPVPFIMASSWARQLLYGVQKHLSIGWGQRCQDAVSSGWFCLCRYSGRRGGRGGGGGGGGRGARAGPAGAPRGAGARMV